MRNRIPYPISRIVQRKMLPLLIFLLCGGLSLFLAITKQQEETVMVMGGVLESQCIAVDEFLEGSTMDLEKYFRPSKLPILNNNVLSQSFLENTYDKKPEEIFLPPSLSDTAENTILNYFSILRDAANPVPGKSAGCGTIGEAQMPYPISYGLLSNAYQKNLPYDAYLKTYENILHISLLKLHQIPLKSSRENALQYFVELETIEGTEKETGVFAYYYGFIDLEKEADQYKITDLHYFDENFLCAPYHGWQWEAEANVNIRYGDWCNLIKGEIQKTQTDDIIRVFFDGTDGFNYCIVFFQLTNGTDLEVAQYRKTLGGTWEPAFMNVEDCLENKQKLSR